MFQSTKILELGSCAFRQPRAESHCRYLHGYKLSAKFWFEAKELDKNNWVVDFGSLKEFKSILQEQFDHTTCIDYSDPHVETFKQLAVDGVCDLRLMNGVGIEKFTEWCYFAANKFVAGMTDNRCNCIKVELFEHENNSAIYEVNSGDYLTTRADSLNKAFDSAEEQYAPATKEAVTQEVKPVVTQDPNTREKLKEQKDLTKPPFKGTIKDVKEDEVVGSTVPEAKEKKKDEDPPLYPKKQTNKWINPESTWGI